MSLFTPLIGPLIASRAYSAGQFLFVLDGAEDASFIKTVSGGAVKGAVISETIGPSHLQYKHVGSVEIEPINVELGMAMSKPMLTWIQQSWKRDFSRKHGEIIHADFNHRGRHSQEFRDALITETIFPTLDGGSPDLAYLKMGLLPEHVDIKNSTAPLQAFRSTRQIEWTSSNFALHIEGMDCSKVNRIDSFSVKQQVKKLYVGRERLPQIEPAAIEFSNLTIYMAAGAAQQFIDWHRSYILNGAKDTESEKQGWLTFKAQEKGSSLFTVMFNNIGIYSLSFENSEADSAKVKRCKVELYIESMELRFDGDGFGPIAGRRRP